MFPPITYTTRRNRLKEQLHSGMVLFLGNGPSPINYADNHYPFRQDSSFLYYFGLDTPYLSAIIDIDDDYQCVFGEEATDDDIVWTGPRLALQEQCRWVGVDRVNRPDQLHDVLSTAAKKGKRIHFLPPYRAETAMRVAGLLRLDPSTVQDHVSVDLIKAVVAQRSVKDNDEINQIEAGLEITYEMQILAMKAAKVGRYEREIFGDMEGLVLAKGTRPAFPTIFTIHGQTLHQHSYDNQMKRGEIAINDCAAESNLHYASDITRTIPIGGKFSQKQREIYSVVLQAQEEAIAMIRRGVEFRDVHRRACLVLMEGLRDLGLVRGDPKQAVQAGAHTLFFPCGVGHTLGLDVHDMEALGEDYVGYTDAIKRRAEFGWRWLRLAKALEPGYVVTVEPGIYFIPELIDRWRAAGRCAERINYEWVEEYRDFGGIRIEDDVLVTDGGNRVLGKPIPKTIEEIEAISSRD